MICTKYGLLEKPSLFDFLQEKIITLVPFLTAIIAISKYADNKAWLILYFGIIGGHMIHILLKRCPHCSYYKNNSEYLTCLWWRWIPKIRKSNNESPPKYLSFYTPVALLIITLFPIYWLTFQWELLVIYILSWSVLSMSIFTSGCSRCLDLNCKFNNVPKEVHENYLLNKND